MHRRGVNITLDGDFKTWINDYIRPTTRRPIYRPSGVPFTHVVNWRKIAAGACGHFVHGANCRRAE